MDHLTGSLYCVIFCLDWKGLGSSEDGRRGEETGGRASKAGEGNQVGVLKKPKIIGGYPSQLRIRSRIEAFMFDCSFLVIHHFSKTQLVFAGMEKHDMLCLRVVDVDNHWGCCSLNNTFFSSYRFWYLAKRASGFWLQQHESKHHLQWHEPSDHILTLKQSWMCKNVIFSMEFWSVLFLHPDCIY